MHTIKFRGKSLSTGEWVYGWYIREARGLINGLPAINLSQAEIVSFIVYSEEGQLIIHEVDPNTVGQYVGVKDQNEKESHIGDICKSFFGDNIGVIEWHKTNPWIVLRYVDSRNGMYSFDHLSLEAFEIIGNLTDNPDLLTQ